MPSCEVRLDRLRRLRELVEANEARFVEAISADFGHRSAVAEMMRLLVEHFLPSNGLAAPGIDELRWPRPVHPGDTLRVLVTVLSARRSRSKPDRGLIQTHVEMFNQLGEPVLTMKPMNLVRCRPESVERRG